MGKVPFDPITKRTYHQLDTGWSWVIMSATFGLLVLLIGYQRSFGQVFVALSDTYGYSSTTLSAINGITQITYSMFSLLVMNVLLKKMSVRSCVLIGSFLQAAGVFGCSVCIDPPCLMIFLGFLHGAGYAMTYSPVILILSQYFEKHRSIATAIATSGTSVGGMAFPYITRYLLNTFSLHGTFLLLGGILFHQSIFAALLQPIIRKQHQQQHHQNDQNHQQQRENTVDRTAGHLAVECQFTGITESHTLTLNEHSLQNRDGNGVDLELDKSLHERNICNEDNSEGIASLLGDESSTKSLSGEDTTRRCARIPHVLGMHTFWLVALHNVGGMTAASVPAIYIPPLAHEKGLTDSDAALFLTVIGVADFMGRLLAGLILHFKLTKPCQLSLITTVCMGVLFSFTSLFQDVYSLLLLSVLYGLFASTFLALQSLVLIEVFGLEHLRSALGYIAVILGATCGASYPIAGLLSDTTGSYTSSFHFFGASSFLAVFTMIIILIPMYRSKWGDMGFNTNKSTLKSN